MYGKLLERDQKKVQHRLDEKLKAQRHAANRIMQHYQDLTAVLLDPEVDDAALRRELLAAVPESELRMDQSALANWTRGDPKARFEETATATRRAEPLCRAVPDPHELHR